MKGKRKSIVASIGILSILLGGLLSCEIRVDSSTTPSNTVPNTGNNSNNTDTSSTVIPQPTYDVTFESVTNGTISASKNKATAGENVTIYFTPNANYSLYSFTVNDIEYYADSATKTETRYEYTAVMVEDGLTIGATFYADVTSNASTLVTDNVLTASVNNQTNLTVNVDSNVSVESLSASMTSGSLTFDGTLDSNGAPINTISINGLDAVSLASNEEQFGFSFNLASTDAKRTVTFKNVNIALGKDGLASLISIENDNRDNDNTELVFDNVNFILSSSITSKTRILQANWIKNVSFNNVKAYSAEGVTSYFYNFVELIGSNLEKLEIKNSSFTGSYAKAVFIERTSRDGVIDVSNCTFTNNATAYNGAFTFGNAGYDTTTFDHPMILNITDTNLTMNQYNGMYILGQINAWADASNPYVKINFNNSKINNASINSTDDIYVAIYTSNRSEDNPYEFLGFYVDGVKATVEY